MSWRTGIGYDSHRLAEGRRLVLGGVEVAGSGAWWATDADVLTHAVMDALLERPRSRTWAPISRTATSAGATPTASRYLAEVRSRLAAQGLEPVHLDAVLICEAPGSPRTGRR